MDTKLYKSDDDLVFYGVCGGIAEYFGFNSTTLRVIWVISIGFSFWLYIALAILMPNHFESRQIKRK